MLQIVLFPILPVQATEVNRHR